MQNEQDQNLVALIKDPDLKMLSLLNSSDFQEQLLFGSEKEMNPDAYLEAMTYADELKYKLTGKYKLVQESSAAYIQTAINVYRQGLIDANKKDGWRIKHIHEQLLLRANLTGLKLKASLDPIDVYGYVIDYDGAHTLLLQFIAKLHGRGCIAAQDFYRRGRVLLRSGMGKQKVSKAEFYRHKENMVVLGRDYARLLRLCEKKSGPPDPGGGGGGGGTSAEAVAIKKFNEAIDDTNLPDCMKGVSDSLKKLSGNTVADIIKKFAGIVPGYNLNFKMVNLSDISQVSGVKTTVSKAGYVTINFNSNPDVLRNVSDLAVATTILHESIHAILSHGQKMTQLTVN